jgi:hypothetical protein
LYYGRLIGHRFDQQGVLPVFQMRFISSTAVTTGTHPLAIASLITMGKALVCRG